MTPRAFRRARHKLGLSLDGMAKALRLGGSRTIRRYEDGSREISGPVSLCADLLPPLVILLREWEGWSVIEVFEASGLSEMAADAVGDLRKIVAAGSIG